MKAWFELAGEGAIPIRVFLSIFYHVFEAGGADFPKPNQRCGLLTADRIKLFGDGALGASTAALSENYKGKNHSGMALQTVDSLTEKFDKLHSAGWRVEIHVIGDRAVDIALDSMERSKGTAEQKRKFRHILNHSQMIRPDHIPRIKEFGRRV